MRTIVTIALFVVLLFFAITVGRILYHGVDEAFSANPIGVEDDSVAVSQWSTFSRNVRAYNEELQVLNESLGKATNRVSQSRHLSFLVSATINEWSRQAVAPSPPSCAGTAEGAYMSYLIYNTALFGGLLSNISEADTYSPLEVLIEWQSYVFDDFSKAFNEAERNCTA